MLAGRADLWALRLRRDAGGIGVVAAGGPVATIDTTTFTAGLPSVHSTRDLRPWLILGAVLLLGLLAAAARTAIRRQPSTA